MPDRGALGDGDGSSLVTHYGPAAGTPGGMGAVLEAYTRLEVPGHRLDVVPTFHPDARCFSAARFAAALADLTRHRTRRRSTFHVHLSERGSFVREGALVVLGRLLGAPVLISLHGADLDTFAVQHPRLVRFVLRRADVLCALGPATAEVVAEIAGRRDRVAVLPNPVAVPDDVTPVPDGDVVLFAGQVCTRKGVDVLVEAWPAVRAARPTAQLLVAGPLVDVPETALDLAGVTWLGTLSREEVAKRLREARLAVLPSRAEVLPMFLIEAMASGRAVVATDVGDVRWLVGEGGRVVAPEDPAALAAALVDLLGDPTAAASAARCRAVEVFSLAAVGSRLVDLYTPLVARRRRRAGADHPRPPVAS